jgi:NADH:ubiquinone oxidoreductase subunit C
MYGIFYKNKLDCRKLLLDYTKNEFVLLKDFPSEGYSDYFFNILEQQVCSTQTEVVEL